MGYNIAYGKIGKSIKFSEHKWNTLGGDIEAPTLLLTMSKLYPKNTYYIIGGNDFKSFKDKEKYKNIISLNDDFNESNEQYLHIYIYKKIKSLNIKIDFAIIYNGICSSINIPDVDYLNSKNKITKSKCLLFIQNYVSPIFYFLNESNVDWFLLAPDARYLPLASYDLYNIPNQIFSQYNSIINFRTRNLITKQNTITKIKEKYTGLENVCLMNWKKIDKSKIHKHRKTKITIILNESKFGKHSRGRYLESYILNQFNNVDIYGNWSEPYSNLSNFKGPKTVIELNEILHDTRYTLCIPTLPNYVTSKFVEMVHFGIIPFLHHTYDTQRNLKNIPEFLRCKNEIDFKQKIQYLEKNKEFRENLQLELYNLYPEKGYYDGRKFINKLNYQMMKIINNK